MNSPSHADRGRRPTSYLIYARVSPKGSDWAAGETSIPDQVAQCRGYILARDPGADIETVSDQFAQGDNPDRPGYRGIYNELAAGNAPWDVLVTRHLDRLWRSVAQGADCVRLLAAHGKGLVCVAQGFDFTGPAGRLQLHILLSIAEYEKAMCSERTRSRMVAIAASGCWPVGKAPVGYRRGAAHDNVLQVDPERAGVVQAIFRDYADAKGGAVELGRRYGMSKQTVLNVLRNRTYLGRVCYGGQEYPGKHQPLVDEGLWRRVQVRLPALVGKAHVVPNKANRVYVLAGLVWCNCGGQMTPASANGRREKYHYYQCRCGTRVQAEMLEQATAEILSERRLTDEEIAGVVTELQRDARKEAKAVAPALRTAEASLAAERARLERLAGLLESGAVARENLGDWNERYAACRARVDELTGQVATLKEKAGADKVPAGFWEDVARRLRDLRPCVELAKDRPEDLRELVLPYVARVERRDRYLYAWTMTAGFGGAAGSSERLSWLRIVDLGEPLWPWRERIQPGIPRAVRRRMKAPAAQGEPGRPSGKEPEQAGVDGCRGGS